jgi:hypothetical protein
LANTRNRILLPALAALCLLGVVHPRGLSADFAVFRAPSHIVSLFALPGETVTFDLAGYSGTSPKRLERFQVDPGSVAVDRHKGRFRLRAPEETGIYPVVFQETVKAGLTPPLPYRVQLVVLVPASRVSPDGILNGYPVGAFPGPETNGHWRFERPRGFVEITEENRDILLSDHRKLGDLDCKLLAPYPHYAVIQTSLLVKLEGLTDILLKRGLPGDHITVMSGFRTPEYNRSIGNRTTYSRHIAGDAADVFVDADGDDRMDDLNGDGRINRRDSRYLLAIVEEMDQSTGYAGLVGGASAYRANADHGPFLHVDTRGFPARW